MVECFCVFLYSYGIYHIEKEVIYKITVLNQKMNMCANIQYTYKYVINQVKKLGELGSPNGKAG